MNNTPDQKRCFWVPKDDPLYIAYHDHEWGIPAHDDRVLFEMLALQGIQAGLSWITILRKREAYREAFDQFDIGKILVYDEDKIEQLMQNPGIIRNRMKINAVINNARNFRDIQNEFGSFDCFLWKYVDGKPMRLVRTGVNDIPSRTELSDKISNDLKKRGFKFVGSTTICAYMHAVGLVNGHADDCFCMKNQER